MSLVSCLPSLVYRLLTTSSRLSSLVSFLFFLANAEKTLYYLRKDAEIVRYIYQHDDWPRFRWRDEALVASLAGVRHRQGRLIGRMESLGFRLREESVLGTLTEDVIRSSEIEGEHLDRAQVRSSIARKLGMDVGGLIPADRDVEGVVEMLVDATQNYALPLTAERLFGWHAALFPTGRSGMSKIVVGNWRDDASGPMQVVSGPVGREHVHYQAPAAKHVAREMGVFLKWFEDDKPIDPVLAAGVAHLWIVTVHPFADGNGRIARAVTDLALARSEHSSRRFYSMSSRIRFERGGYYDILEATQRGGLDITPWLQWFLACLNGAFDQAEQALADVFARSRFWETIGDTPLNERQRLMLNRLLERFEGKLTSSKWAKLAKCSQDTAARDIDDLVRKGILARGPAGGRSTSYDLIT